MNMALRRMIRTRSANRKIAMVISHWWEEFFYREARE